MIQWPNPIARRHPTQPLQLSIKCLLLVLLQSALSEPKTALPQLSDLARVKPRIYYTIARQHDTLEFFCDQRHRTLLWVLPNNQIVRPNQTDGDEEVFSFYDSTVVVTEHTLKIPDIRMGMDGRFSCLLENGEQFHFYVLQVSSQVNFFNAIILSITVSIGLVFIFLTVLFLDKYCSRPGSVVRPASSRPDERINDPLVSQQWL